MAYPYQPALFATVPSKAVIPFPSTRYQGSKRALAEWIWDSLSTFTIETVLDAFGGTGAVSHRFKNGGKRVFYNDLLQFNTMIGRALIENSEVLLPDEMVEQLLAPSLEHPSLIQQHFKGIYFTDDENEWLDRTSHHIRTLLSNPYTQAIAWFALFQACIAKRPYNLFHRANLYMRTAQVERSFGNKTTWDTPFEVHFRAFVKAANQAIFDNGQLNQSLNGDVLVTPIGLDLVYLDPPYLNQQGVGVDYRDFYHFLEGFMNYEAWEGLIDFTSKHRRLKRIPSAWNHPDTHLIALGQVIERHHQSIIAISYREDGLPTIEQLIALLKHYKPQVKVMTQPKQYVLSSKSSQEVLLIGHN